MALRRCRSLSGVPQMLWNYTVLPEASVARVRISAGSNINLNSTLASITPQRSLRRFSSESPSTDVSYEQMKRLLVGRRSVVIDVREPWELREYGIFPGSINVPFGQVKTALQLDPKEFKEIYGGEMPQQTDNVVFTCLAGVRSKMALNTAFSLGYKDVQHYPGGWQDWTKKEHM